MIIDIDNMDKLNYHTKDHRVLIDVWANWCGPCKMMSPILYDLEQELSPKLIEQGRDQLRILKIDTDNGNLESFLVAYNINSVPTFIVYDNGKVVNTHVGATSKEKFREFIMNNFAYI